jgi:hypothetical protein
MARSSPRRRHVRGSPTLVAFLLGLPNYTSARSASQFVGTHTNTSSGVYVCRMQASAGTSHEMPVATRIHVFAIQFRVTHLLRGSMAPNAHWTQEFEERDPELSSHLSEAVAFWHVTLGPSWFYSLIIFSLLELRLGLICSTVGSMFTFDSTAICTLVQITIRNCAMLHVLSRLRWCLVQCGEEAKERPGEGIRFSSLS